MTFDGRCIFNKGAIVYLWQRCRGSVIVIFFSDKSASSWRSGFKEGMGSFRGINTLS
jgi:hypothetical protein